MLLPWNQFMTWVEVQEHGCGWICFPAQLKTPGMTVG